MKYLKFDPRRISNDLYTNFCEELKSAGFTTCECSKCTEYKRTLFSVCYKIAGKIRVEKGGMSRSEFNNLIDRIAVTAACSLINPMHFVDRCDWNECGDKLLHSEINDEMILLYELIELASKILTKDERHVLGHNFRMILSLNLTHEDLDLAA
ncbi:hypothetical protein [Desulforhopalus singaporensis]|uniref:Uncharacterized protein n=1 Tax=Desulforhopalus singaporensis TaxID=91360 RepID=A0A1H0QZV2_9BACT|nr:hypothetical protein [Desulforhopalus singaporensis]SDP22842.1 hypothetical protein SAMN05660330_02154 [Desulforhopalus singaporensis]